MSRNFELLQQLERNRNLFLTAPPLPPSPAAELILEEPVPKKPAPDKGRAEERVEKDRVREPRPSNSYRPATAAPSWNNTPSKWFAPPREGTKRLGMSLNGPRSNGHGAVDVKAMALQEEIKLVQRVIFSNDASSNRAIMFSTVENGERSVRICVRAAETLAAQVQSSVSVVDSNLHSPSLRQDFGTTSILGLSEPVLRRGPSRDFAQPLAKSSLWLIPSGAGGENYWALPNSDGVRARFEELRTQFDYVLINAPPMNEFADLALIGQVSDGVVEANSPRRETTQRWMENL